MEIFPPETAAGSGRERVGGSRNERERGMRMVANGTETWGSDYDSVPWTSRWEKLRVQPRKLAVCGWRYSVRGHKQKQVRSLGMSSRCALVHLRAQTQPVHSLRPPHPSPHPRLCCTTWARIRLLNKLFRKNQLSSANSAHNNNMKLSIVLASNHV